ncbi:TetR/AcrR family transcriptional regulator [Herbiconiux sp. CPCC 205763]|uniref:TetR/AcrR family transcriptional regulator n=1 Tax=Herbiconiux aconitum TaxID=2970913 RepID=A0ABT2GN77_9MICO|nr:TetR/AcrR family transcriptional regulator [Herbiconiux aconitum]MCS5717680.1 TetR/AcrR family transcriptional regulator [Herbiconiux aconitum]
MEQVQRGRPRDAQIDHDALTATVDLLEEVGYDALRMKDVAARAGIGLGALYRRWSGKQELVVAALQLGTHVHDAAPGADPVDELVAALLRISTAVPKGLGALVAACLRDPGSEVAAVARDAKLAPMVAAVSEHLERCIGQVPDLTGRAELAPAFILWRAALTGFALDEEEVRANLLPLLGVTSHDKAN